MLIQGIASILHRDTIAVIVGARTFERGEECFTSKRVLEVEAARGELRGRVKPTESQRAHYTCRIWLRDEGVAYDMLSGDTHLLEPLALELLQRLEPDVPRSARALLDSLADIIVDDGPESALTAIEQSLESMRRVGLVVATPA